MAKSKKAVVIEKKHKVQKAPKIKVVPKVQKKVAEVKKAEPKVKKAQPKIVQPKAKKEKPKVQKVEPEVQKVKAKIEPEVIAHWVTGIDPYNKRYDGENKPANVSVKIDEALLNVTEMTIKEIMLQKGLSYEGAISFLKANQRK